MSDARAYAQRNQRGSDWFSHDATASSTAAAASKPAPPPAVEQKTDDSAQSGRTQMIKPKCESNSWFKHEHSAESPAKPAPAAAVAPTAAADAPAAAAPAPVAAAPAPVAAYTAAPAAAEPAVTAATAAPIAAPAAEATQASREGDVNSRRDKAGSSASWFSHEHQEPTATQGPRVTSKEGGANASRMRGESEQWFNYDNIKDQQGVHVGKGRSARTQTDSMSQIFNQGH